MYHAAELVHWMQNRDIKVLLPAQIKELNRRKTKLFGKRN